MKANIHPQYDLTTVTCSSCGTTWTTRSTGHNLRTELCSVCHPFYSGEQRIVDTAGQVERFMNKMNAAQTDRGASKKHVRRDQKLQERERARTFTPELEALAEAAETAPAQ